MIVTDDELFLFVFCLKETLSLKYGDIAYLQDYRRKGFKDLLISRKRIRIKNDKIHNKVL